MGMKLKTIEFSGTMTIGGGFIYGCSSKKNASGEYVRARAAQKALDSLRNMRALAIPGMNWTDETGRAALSECDAAIAALAAKE